jgi:hypothetical protein
LESAKFAALNLENSSALRNQTVQDFTCSLSRPGRGFTKRFWPKVPKNGSSGGFEMISNIKKPFIRNHMASEKSGPNQETEDGNFEHVG